jgi:serine/threonine-protein kinase
VAPVIVRRAAKRHTDFNALSSELAEQIAEEEPRAEFLRSIKAHGQAPHSRPTGDPASAISAHSMRVPAAADKSVLQTRFALDMLAAIEADLARHIGPLAKVLVKKSAAKARDKAELYLLLSDHISDEAERKAFVRKSMQAFRAKT